MVPRPPAALTSESCLPMCVLQTFLSKMVSPLQGIIWLVGPCQSSQLEPSSRLFISAASPGASGTVFTHFFLGGNHDTVKSWGVRRAWSLGLGEESSREGKKKGASMRAGEGAAGPSVLPREKIPRCFSEDIPALPWLCDHGWAPPLSGP